MELGDGIHADGGGLKMMICCPIVELRQYTLHAGRRETLIELFEREFIESQEALGMSVIGQFRDRDDANRFVWLRGFPSMAARGEALGSFYGGPVWQAHREAANATMLDSDNVLLLHHTPGSAGFALAARHDGGHAEERPAESVVVATIHYLDDASAGFARFFAAAMMPTIAAAGGRVLATLATEGAKNNFPRLPVRERETVFVWFGRFPDLAAHERFGAALRHAEDWREGASPEILRQFMRKPEVLTLIPTRRSLLR
jgi:hypothetical protein